ncbi:MAG: hypothetical protein HQL32_14405 [Planctomycetes bacterium]|nr:hypothetical protein [Planctomycetota bacterium]
MKMFTYFFAFLLILIGGIHSASIKPKLNQAKLKNINCKNDNLDHWKKTGQADIPIIVKHPGQYYIQFEYAGTSKICGTLQVMLNKEVVIEEELKRTGSWEDFKNIKLKTPVVLTAGEHKLTLKGTKVPTNYFINLRKLILADGDETTDPIDYSFIKMGMDLDSPETQKAFTESMLKALELKADEPHVFAKHMWAAFPLMCDWLLQDNSNHKNWGYSVGYDSRGDFEIFLEQGRDTSFEQELVKAVAKELGQKADPKGSRGELLERYIKLCSERRAKRLQDFKSKHNNLIYAKHQLAVSIYLATETSGCPKGSELRQLNLNNNNNIIKDELLFDSKDGIVRDPELSFDAKKLLFAWRKTHKSSGTVGRMAPETGNYKIYEMDMATRNIRQLTDDKTYGADIEPCYLPNGDIIFSSVRCVQEVTCGWGDCSNLFVMDKDGNYARRLGFDQTQTAFPHLLNDGRIVYTRRDYNDRGQTFAHSLFVMNADGTSQTEYYGNNTTEPTSLQHTRPIPGTTKSMSIAGGYHTTQGGKLAIINPSKGRQKYEGIEFINWDHTKKRTGGDGYGREGDQYTYPYPLSEKSLLISYSPIGGYLFNKNGIYRRDTSSTMRYKLYHMTTDGKREMLAADPIHSCMQAIPLTPRKAPTARATSVDYTKDKGVMYVQNVYFGKGTEGVKQGNIKKIRINELHYKPITIGAGGWSPPRDQVGVGKKYAGYGWHSVLPTGVGSASFDAKTILGEVDVHEDGSAMFEVPARTPIYLQLIDDKNHVVQSMRSWATLMPNEKFSCVGCHEDKNATPLQAGKVTMAMHREPQKIKSFHHVSGKPFSFAKNVQPILNKHCTSCHAPGKKAESFDLSDTIVKDAKFGNSSTHRKFYQSYLTLVDAKWTTNKVPREAKGQKRIDEGRPNKWVDYYTRLLTVESTPPYYAGSTKSGLIKHLRKGHKKVKISEDELAIISAWIDLNVPFIGDYDEMHNWTEEEVSKYNTKLAMRTKQEEIERKNIDRFIEAGQPQ